MGKVANCQVGVFLAWASEQGHALVDKALYLPREGTQDRERCRAAGVPEAIDYRSKAELALDVLRQARQGGHWPADWLTADAGYGEVPSFCDALAAEGWRYVVEVPSTLTVFTQAVQTAVPAWSGRGRQPTREQVKVGEPGAQTVAAVAGQRLPTQWRTLTVAEGAQGPRHLPVWRRCGSGKAGTGWPGRESWLLVRCNWDGSELKYHLAECAGRHAAVARWPKSAPCAGRLRPSFRPRKAKLAWTSMKSVVGTAGIITSPWPYWPAAFLLTLQLDWGKKAAPDHPHTADAGLTRTAAAAHVDER